MKKQILIVGIIIILLAVGLSGYYLLSQKTGDINKVELVDYDVKSYSYNLSADNPVEWKEITGTVKNIAGTQISKIIIEVQFYDSNNNLLITKTDTAYDIASSNTKEFMVEYANTENYYENVDWNNIKFEFTVV